MFDTFAEYVDWQWSVNSWTKQDSPAAAINHYLAAARTGANGGAGTAFAWLCYGVRNEPAAVRLYQQTREALGDEALYAAVLKAAGRREPDFTEAGVHLLWQAFSSPLSLTSATSLWATGRTSAGTAAVEAMYVLTAGQSHNASACQLYRSCLASDAARLFALAREQVSLFTAGGLDHPYLKGQGAGAHSLRDQVPSVVAAASPGGVS
ncbi:hypothetical protein KGQ19_36735 [Catenulispora sp. NL8]|uniref:Uncharacterized protein n=1 Tax=Catenulispora pinistramenti TaxID=2705254 RepID=A0ABS5L246_9ACTN|nr:hypothetical protein [Catenulispora pinistramenti]MBS2552417.1 hypothetical protein [Catenulispora pinistramenti]